MIAWFLDVLLWLAGWACFLTFLLGVVVAVIEAVNSKLKTPEPSNSPPDDAAFDGHSCDRYLTGESKFSEYAYESTLEENDRKEPALDYRKLVRRIKGTSRVDAKSAERFDFGGSQHVYVYTFPSHERSGKKRCPYKIGYTVKDPVKRIHDQLNPTSLSEKAVVRLIVKVVDGRAVEKDLHRSLRRSTDAVGTEWFNTNITEIKKLLGIGSRTRRRRYK